MENKLGNHSSVSSFLYVSEKQKPVSNDGILNIYLRFQVYESYVSHLGYSAFWAVFTEYKTRCIPETFPDFLPPISNIHCVDRYLFYLFLVPTFDLTLASPNHHVATRTMHCSTSSNLSRASPMFVTVFALFTSVCTGLPAAGSSAIVPGAYVPSLIACNGC